VVVVVVVVVPPVAVRQVGRHPSLRLLVSRSGLWKTLGNMACTASSSPKQSLSDSGSDSDCGVAGARGGSEGYLRVLSTHL